MTMKQTAGRDTLGFGRNSIFFTDFFNGQPHFYHHPFQVGIIIQLGVNSKSRAFIKEIKNSTVSKRRLHCFVNGTLGYKSRCLKGFPINSPKILPFPAYLPHPKSQR